MALIKLTLSEMSNVKSQISSLAERTESNGTAVARIASFKQTITKVDCILKRA